MPRTFPAFRARHVVLAVVFLMGLAFHPTPSSASQAGSDGSAAGSAAPADSYVLAFSDAATNAVVQGIREGAGRCASLPWIYRHDCLSQIFRDASRLNRDRPDYREARSILRDAGKKLDKLVDQNLDRAQPKAKLGRKSYRPVQRARRAEVSKAGRAIIQEAEIRLLRSGGIQKRQEHYQRIAAAVDATELLLRAALLRLRPVVAAVPTARSMG